MSSSAPDLATLAMVRLTDGSPALVRGLRPEDRAALAAGFGELSAASRRMRFHSAGFRLGRRELDLLMDIDGVDRVALVATRPDGFGLGIARYVRDPDEPSVAEPAVTVLDRYQRLGVGTLLLSHLADHAMGNGIETFTAPVLAENAAMVALLARLGVSWRRAEGGMLGFEVDLANPEVVPAMIRARARTSADRPPADRRPGLSPSPTR